MSERNELMKKERLNYIDNFRFFGILCMVAGHVGFGEAFDQWIHAFHMPMWFFISGFFTNINEDILSHMKKRVHSMITPFLFFSIFYILIDGIMNGGMFDIESLIWPNHNCVPFNGALWFLQCLLISDTIAFVILKYTSQWIGNGILILVAIIWSAYIIKLPFTIDSAIVGIGFFSIGNMFRKIGKSKLSNNLWVSLTAVLLFSALCFLNIKVNMRSNEYGNIALFWLIAIGMCLSLWNLFAVIGDRWNNSVVSYIGRNSVIYVCMNQFILYWLKFFNPSNVVGKMGWKICELVLVMVGCYWIDFLIKNTWLKNVFK